MRSPFHTNWGKITLLSFQPRERLLSQVEAERINTFGTLAILVFTAVILSAYLVVTSIWDARSSSRQYVYNYFIRPRSVKQSFALILKNHFRSKLTQFFFDLLYSFHAICALYNHLSNEHIFWSAVAMDWRLMLCSIVRPASQFALVEHWPTIE